MMNERIPIKFQKLKRESEDEVEGLKSIFTALNELKNERTGSE
jgi:hypothetical protein